MRAILTTINRIKNRASLFSLVSSFSVAISYVERKRKVKGSNSKLKGPYEQKRCIHMDKQIGKIICHLLHKTFH